MIATPTARRPLRMTAVFVVCVLAFAGLARAAGDEDVVGEVVRIQGAAIAMQDALPRPLKVGTKVLAGDVISTGKGARVEVKMVDDAVLTLGEKTIFVVMEYLAGGAEPNAAMRLLQGAFSAASGKMMQQANAGFRVETDAATIGVRGTTFWGGALDGVFEVALLAGKSITVETRAGRVVLDEIGEGTAIRGAGVAPTAPKLWAAEKVTRAKATVAFR